MKQFTHLFAILFLIGPLNGSNESYEANLNGIIDEITLNINKYGKEVGFDPLEIPDIRQDYLEGVVVELRNGSVMNTKSVHRYGDTMISFNSELLKAKFAVKFSNLETNFTFNLRAYGLEPEGQLTAVIPHLAAVIEVEINAINISVVLNELLVPTTGEIKIDIQTTKPIYGDVMETLIKTMETLFQDEVIYIIGRLVKEKVNEFIQQSFNF